MTIVFSKKTPAVIPIQAFLPPIGFLTQLIGYSNGLRGDIPGRRINMIRSQLAAWSGFSGGSRHGKLNGEPEMTPRECAVYPLKFPS